MARRVIDLRKGHPKPRNLPHLQLAEACRAAAAKLSAGEDSFRLQYSLRPTGTTYFLEQLSCFLSRAYGSPVFEDTLCTTNGVSHGIELAVGALTKPGDSVWMEAPSYFLAHQIFVDHHLCVRAMPTDKHGLDTDALATLLESGDIGPPPTLVYIIPSHGNPTATVLPIDRRRALLDLAERWKFVVLADDVYHLLDWGDRPVLPRLLQLDPAYASRVGAHGADRPDESNEEDDDPVYHAVASTGGHADNGRWQGEGRVVSIGSFTKILAPGLRCGWLEASSALIARISRRGYIVSGGSVAPFASEIVAELLSSGAQADLLALLKRDYAASSRALCAALRRSDHCTVLVEPEGGFFVWCTLPEGITAESLLPIAERHGVVFLPGTMCAPSSPAECFARCLRLCFAYEEADACEEGVRRLSAAIDEALRGPGVADGDGGAAAANATSELEVPEARRRRIQ